MSEEQTNNITDLIVHLRESKGCGECKWSTWTDNGVYFCHNLLIKGDIVSRHNICSQFDEKQNGYDIIETKACMNCKKAVDNDHTGWGGHSTCSITGKRNYNYMVCDNWDGKQF